MAGVLLCGYYGGSPNFRAGSEQELFGGDYFQEWFGGRLVLAGTLSAHYQPQRAEALQHDPRFTGFSWKSSRYFPLVYPPYYYALVSPLSHFPYQAAAVAWAVVMTCCYIAAAVLMMRWLRKQPSRAWGRFGIWILPLGLLFPPIAESLVMNQKGTLCLLIVVATYVALHKGRPISAGLCFGWLFFKPQLALPIMLVMLWKKQFRFCFGCLIVLAVLAVLGLATGIDAFREYLYFVVKAPDYIYNAGYSVARSHCVDSFFHGVFASHPLVARVATGIASLTLILLALRFVRGPLNCSSPRFGLQYCGLILITILISPHLYGYDLSMLLLPFVIIVAFAFEGRPTRLGTSAAYLVAALFCLSGLSEFSARVSGIQVSVMIMATLLGVLYVLAESMKPSRDSNVESGVSN